MTNEHPTDSPGGGASNASDAAGDLPAPASPAATGPRSVRYNVLGTTLCPKCGALLKRLTWGSRYHYRCEECGWHDVRAILIDLDVLEPPIVAVDEWCGSDPMAGKSREVIAGGRLYMNKDGIRESLSIEWGLTPELLQTCEITLDAEQESEDGWTFTLTTKEE